MGIIEKIKAIQQLTGSNQDKLALRLGVTFATFNRWINGKAAPRKSAQKRIDELFLHLTGQNVISADQLLQKKNRIYIKQRSFPNVLNLLRSRQDLYDQYLLSFTYNTNRMEGSTLTEPETAALLFQNVSLPDKSLVEQMEVKNHQAAFYHLIHKTDLKAPLSEEWILRIHGILMNGILTDAGSYRKHGVRIVGSYVPTANYLKVPTLMSDLIDEMETDGGDVLKHTAIIHERFGRIHPFSDGNGRVGRLLMAAMLLRKGFAPAIVEERKKRFYLMYLQQAQLNNDSSRLEDFILDGILTGYAVLESGDDTI